MASSRDDEDHERDDLYTKDGSVDLRGNPVLRSKRGGWTACSFVVVYEVFERMAYYGISSNLVIYLTKKLNQGTVTSANNVTNWVGTMWITPILGAYFADAHLGTYRTFVIASSIYFFGMCLLTLAVSLPSLRPPGCHEVNAESCSKASTLQLGVFYGALYTLAIGTGGTKPTISTIGANQFDEFDPKEKGVKLSFFNWWMFSIFFGTLFANTILVYVQDNVGWKLGYGLPTLGLAISILVFFAGTPFYRHKLPAGSPFTKMVMVIVASLRNWRLPLPSNPNDLYDLESEEYTKKGKIRIDSTSTLRFLNRSAIRTGESGTRHAWKLCTVTQVEETKQILRMIPILLTTFIPAIMMAQTNTLFIKQGATLDRRLGNHFKIPPASLNAFVTVSMLISVVLYDRFLVKFMQKFTENPRGITLLQRMGIGLSLHVVIMVVASFVERKRLAVAKEHDLVRHGRTVPLTIFILLPQFVLMGIANAFMVVGKIEFFYDQAPETMKNLGTSYSSTSVGIGNFLSSFILSTVSGITKRNGRKGWVLNNLNDSHLDYYYAFLAVLSFVNLMFYLVVTKFIYEYKAEVSDSIRVLTEELKEKKTTKETGQKH